MKVLGIWTTYRPEKPFVVYNSNVVEDGVEGKYFIELANGEMMISNGFWPTEDITNVREHEV